MAITTTPSKPALATPTLLVVPILVLVLYLLPGSLAGKLIGDGEQLTSRNTQVTEPFSWQAVWASATPSHTPARQAYRPVLAQLVRMEYQAWQGSPSSYHAVSLILYLGVVVLFLFYSGQLMRHAGARLAAFVTLALHPIFTQSVENVAGQGVLLSLLATLGALSLFQLCRQGRLGLAWSALLIALLAVVAVGSHEMGLLLPVWLVAVAALTRVEPVAQPLAKKDRKRGAKPAAPAEPAVAPLGTPLRVLALALPLAVVAGGYLVLRQRALGGVVPPPLAGLGSAAAWAGSIFTAYLARLCWPVHPTYFYLLAEKGSILPHPVLGWMVLLAMAALTVYACRRWRALGLGLVLMLTPLAALAHFLPLTTFMSEQPLAFALPGFCLTVGALVERLAAPGLLLPPVKLRDRAVLGLLCLAWLAMAGQTFARVRQWASPEALWAAEAALHPASAQPLIEQLDACVHQSNADAARRLAREARRKGSPAELDRVRELEALLAANIKDDDRLKELIDEALDAKLKPGRDHLSRMAVFARDRDFRAESTDLWRRELQLYPTSFDALYELAQTALDDKNFKDAVRLSADAVRFAPNRRMWARAQERYGVILAESGQVKVAAMTLQQALAAEPTLYRAYIYLARIFWGAKEYQRALDVLDACFQNVSHSLTSYVDLAQMYTGILEDLNQTRLALDWIQGQMASFPSDIPLQIWGARYLIEFGFYDRAYQTYQMVMASPVANDAKSKVAVGLGLLELRVNKHPKEAARYWRSALQLDPTNDDAKRQLDALDHASASVKDQNPAAPAATAAQTSASASALPAAPAPAVAPAPALPSGSGLSLGAPLSGLSVSRPDLATTASKPLAAPVQPKPVVPAATPAAPKPAAPIAIPAAPKPTAPAVTPAAPKPAAPAATPVATPRPTASPTPAAPVAKPTATPAATPVRTPAATPAVPPAPLAK